MSRFLLVVVILTVITLDGMLQNTTSDRWMADRFLADFERGLKSHDDDNNNNKYSNYESTTTASAMKAHDDDNDNKKYNYHESTTTSTIKARDDDNNDNKSSNYNSTTASTTKITDDFSNNSSFCVRWEVNLDDWWTHNPTWEMGKENDTHYCFQRIENAEKRDIFTKLYETQFRGNCSTTITKRMWSSGWNADFLGVMDGLKHAVRNNRPFAVVSGPWHYADPERAKPGIMAYKGIPPVCPQGNLQCYFLPLTNCAPAKEGIAKDILEEAFVGTIEYQWYYEFASRRQTWLRKKVYQFTRQQELQQHIKTPCTAMHVRRGDVVLHIGDFKRKYHPIRDYMNASFGVQKNIFLLTDDVNAIVEAKTEFPEYNWMYIDRPRTRGAEGGWEMQIPSKDPIYEVVVILGIFQMVRQCSQLVHAYSAFASQLYAEMEASGNYQNLTRVRIDPGPVFSKDHGNSVNVSNAYNNVLPI